MVNSEDDPAASVLVVGKTKFRSDTVGAGVYSYQIYHPMHSRNEKILRINGLMHELIVDSTSCSGV